MKTRELKRPTNTEILLGRIYPHLIQLRDSELHGNMGELDILYKGFRIIWESPIGIEYRKEHHNEFEPIHWSSCEGCDMGGGTP